METEPKTRTDERTLPEIERDIETARENGVHVDEAVNPFLSEEARQAIIKGEMQSGEYD